jgi:hypothetical protein
VINNIKTAFKDRLKDMSTWKDLADQAVAEIGNVFGYNYSGHGRVTRNISLGDFEDLRYRCNQRTGGERKKPKIEDPNKQRVKRSKERYDCNGWIRFMFACGDSALVKLGTRTVHLGKWGAIVHFFHAYYHPPDKRQPFPEAIRKFIRLNYKPSAAAMYQELIEKNRLGELQIDLTVLTIDNVRYCWSLIRRERVESDPDAWVSAVAYLQKQDKVLLQVDITTNICRFNYILTLMSGAGIFVGFFMKSSPLRWKPSLKSTSTRLTRPITTKRSYLLLLEKKMGLAFLLPIC